MEGNHIGDVGAKHLAVLLTQNISSLNLSANDIGHAGIEYLAEALRQTEENHSSLKISSLELQNNGFGDKGMQFLAAALKENTVS